MRKTSKIVQLGGGSITDYSAGGNQTEGCVCVCVCVQLGSLEGVVLL